MLNKNDPVDKLNQPPAGSGQVSPIGSAEQRRRFIKGGLAGGGVLMSLASRQVLANAGVCKTASGFTSLAASGPRKSHYVCNGLTPGYWGQPQHAWPAPYTKGALVGSSGHQTWNNAGTKYNSTFGGNKYASSMSMMQVIWLGGGDPYQIGAHFVAALLNAAAGLTNVLTIVQIKAIWMSYVNTGSYSPVPGVVWTPSQIVDYLKSTMPL